MITSNLVCFIGPRRSGKSFLLAREIAGRKRVLGVTLVPDPAFAGFTSVRGNPRQVFIEMKKRPADFRVVFTPNPNSLEYAGTYTRWPGLELVSRLVIEKMRDMTMTIDECHSFMTPHYMPAALGNLVRFCGHKGIHLFCVSHSFAGLNQVVTQNADTFIFWRMISPHDLKGIKDRCGQDVADAVSKLGILREENGKVIPGETLVWTKLNGWEK